MIWIFRIRIIRFVYQCNCICSLPWGLVRLDQLNQFNPPVTLLPTIARRYPSGRLWRLHIFYVLEWWVLMKLYFREGVNLCLYIFQEICFIFIKYYILSRRISYKIMPLREQIRRTLLPSCSKVEVLVCNCFIFLTFGLFGLFWISFVLWSHNIVFFHYFIDVLEQSPMYPFSFQPLQKLGKKTVGPWLLKSL